MTKLGFIYYITTAIAVCTMLLVHDKIGVHQVHVMGIQGMFLTVPTAIPIYLYFRTPRNLQDRFLFHFEFQWTIIVMIGGTLFAVTFILLLKFGHHTVGWTVYMLGMMYQHVCSLLSTLWVPRKVTMMEWDEGGHVAMLQMEHSDGDFRRTLKGLLIDEQKCEAFIDWMYREFSCEVILSFIEFVQFRKFVMDEIKKVDGSDISADPDPYDFAFYDGMPQSTIIYDSFGFDQIALPGHLIDIPSLSADVESETSPTENPLVRCKRIAHLFFIKYINYASHHEINISGRLRNKYVAMERVEYDGMDLEQFVTFYDDVISEMMKYQSESYMRFERENQN